MCPCSGFLCAYVCICVIVRKQVSCVLPGIQYDSCFAGWWARALVGDQSKEGYGKLELKLEG